MRYWKSLLYTAAIIVGLTAAQYGSVHLLAGRPESWLFELSIDVAPSLLFVGDTIQFLASHGSQAALHDQLRAVCTGMAVNFAMYAIAAMIVVYAFSSARSKKER